MKLSTQISLGFLIAISIDLVDSFFNYLLTLKVKTDSEFLNRSAAVIRNSGNLNKGMIDMQSAFRGYLLTDDDQFLQQYNRELDSLPVLIARERPIITIPAEHRILDSIVALHNLWVAYANNIIEAKRRSNSADTSAERYKYLFETQLKKGVGKDYNDEIAGLFRSFNETEYRDREERRIALSESINETDRSSLTFSILLVIIGSGIAIFLVRKISRRIDSLVKLAVNISQGNFSKVSDDRKDELSSLSISLNSMSDKLSRNISDLEKKNAELNQFAYVVSHDLKAPVRGISNIVHWIEEDLGEEVSPAMRKYLDLIPERIKRMESLIDGLLEYARISRNRSLTENVDVEALVGDLVELIVPKEFKVNATGLPTIYTERLLLQQVFANLISNAVKYSGPERGEITVTCKEDGAFYEFSVRDNGPGIAPEYHEKVFEIFQTLRERHDKESTGIGLAIVKKIMDEKQCSIRIVSSPGKGAEFIFTWPKS